MPPPLIPVAILGATGAVGQQLLTLLADHPMFEVVQVVGSADRVGQRYGDTVTWRAAGPLAPHHADLICSAPTPMPGVRIAFSALDAKVAAELEPRFAGAGVLVISNASTYRMAADVPLIIPEVNAEQLTLLTRQRRERGWSGGIVTNPNCSTAVLATVLAPLHRAHGVRTVVAATLQAASGAGYPGVPSLDLIDNVIPFIAGEEPKIESECAKLLGTLRGEQVDAAAFEVSAMVHRVPVTDGHMVSAAIGFDRPPSVAEATATLAAFRGGSLVQGLPSTPEHPIEIDTRDDHPQPRPDRNRGRGMTVTVGRIRTCPVHDIRLVALGHNLIRGAAGAALQNAELVVAQGGLC